MIHVFIHTSRQAYFVGDVDRQDAKSVQLGRYKVAHSNTSREVGTKEQQASQMAGRKKVCGVY